MAENVSTEFPGIEGLDEGLGTDREPRTYEGREAKSRRKLSAKILVPVAILVLAMAAGGLYYFYAGWESTDDAQIDGYVNLVSSRVAGYVTHVYVDDNQYVKAGTLLAQIDPKDYQVALESAKATLANDAGHPLGERSQRSPHRHQYLQPTDVGAGGREPCSGGSVRRAKATSAAQASLAAAEANYAKAQDDVNRYKQLVDKHEIADQQYTQAVETAKAAAAAVDGAQAATQVAQDQVSQAQAKLTPGSAALDSARTGPGRSASRNLARWRRRRWWPNRRPRLIRPSST